MVLMELFDINQILIYSQLDALRQNSDTIFFPLPSWATIWFIADGITFHSNAIPDFIKQLGRWSFHNISLIFRQLIDYNRSLYC